MISLNMRRISFNNSLFRRISIGNENKGEKLSRMLFTNLLCCRAIQRRNLKSFIVGLLFFGLFIYIILSTLQIRQSSDRSTTNEFELEFLDDSSKKSAILINKQLEKIESSLRLNRIIINELRDEMNRFRDHIDESSRRNAPITSVFDGSSCLSSSSLNRSLTLRGDINMLSVYDNLTFDNPDGGVWKQGWPITIDNNEFEDSTPLNVIVMPHSHNDPGWIKTFDTYFQKQTKNILSSAIDKLTNEPEMKFVWSESSYLSAWMDQASESDKLRMINLVKSGQIELVTGGWVMNDEANTYYFSILSQLIDGHEFIEDNFGIIPRHGWANDPFGLSPTMAYLLKKMGFRAMVIQRVHYSIKKYLASQQNLEFHWRQSFEINEQNDILCHVEPFYSYDVPHTCGPDPKICCQFDFKRLPGNKIKCPWKIPPVIINKNNVAERAKLLLDQYRKKSKLFKTRILLVPLGDDFRFDTAKEWNAQFDNYKRLFDYMNSNEKMNVRISFGTLSDYFDALFDEAIHVHESHETFPSLVGDFFTYADRDDHYWSGYYTSKPFYKRFERILQSHVRATEILFSVSNILSSKKGQDPFSNDVIQDLKYARQNLALFQHHDGITGTAKDFVVRDYANRMFNSFLKLQNVLTASLLKFSDSKTLEVEFLNMFPNSETPLVRRTFNSTLKNYFLLYNTLGWIRETELICFNVQIDSSKNWCLKDSSTNLHITDVQINHVWTSFGSFSETVKEVCFQPILKQLSLKQFCVGNCDCESNSAELLKSKETLAHLYNYHRSTKSIVPSEVHILSYSTNPTNLTIQNERFELIFNPENGHLLHSRFYDNRQWNEFDLKAQLMTYGTRKGGKTVPKSGAYIFLPDQHNPKSFDSTQSPNIRIIKGPLELRIEILTQQPIRSELKYSLIRGRNSIDFDTKFHMAGLYGANREFLIRFESKLDNQHEFFTDLNGFQLTGRKYHEKIPIQGNVYPFNTMAFIENDEIRLNILTAQPLGVTVANPGTVDIFLDRRLMQDDERGLDQNVVDNKFTHESFRINIEHINSRADLAYPKSSSENHFESLALLNPIIGIVSKQSNTPILITNQLDILKKVLPCDIHLLNLRRFTKRYEEIGLLIHRFDNQCQCEKSFDFSLNDIFSEQIIANIKHVTVPYTLSFLKPLSFNSTVLTPINIGRSHIVAYKLFNR